MEDITSEVMIWLAPDEVIIAGLVSKAWVRMLYCPIFLTQLGQAWFPGSPLFPEHRPTPKPTDPEIPIGSHIRDFVRTLWAQIPAMESCTLRIFEPLDASINTDFSNNVRTFQSTIVRRCSDLSIAAEFEDQRLVWYCHEKPQDIDCGISLNLRVSDALTQIDLPYDLAAMVWENYTQTRGGLLVRTHLQIQAVLPLLPRTIITPLTLVPRVTFMTQSTLHDRIVNSTPWAARTTDLGFSAFLNSLSLLLFFLFHHTVNHYTFSLRMACQFERGGVGFFFIQNIEALYLELKILHKWC